MHSSEKGFWKKIRFDIRGYWIRIESSTGAGIPDCCAVVHGVTVWVELKDVPKIVAGLGTTAIQRHWMTKWIAAGGRAMLLARCGSSVFLIKGNNIPVAGTRDVYVKAAVAVWENGIDWDELAKKMACND